MENSYPAALAESQLSGSLKERELNRLCGPMHLLFSGDEAIRPREFISFTN